MGYETACRSGEVLPACGPSLRKAEAGGLLEFQLEHSERKASLYYVARPCPAGKGSLASLRREGHKFKPNLGNSGLDQDRLSKNQQRLRM